MNLHRVSMILTGRLVFVTERGVRLQLPALGWDAVDVARVLAQIAALPETPDRDTSEESHG